MAKRSLYPGNPLGQSKVSQVAPRRGPASPKAPVPKQSFVRGGRPEGTVSSPLTSRGKLCSTRRSPQSIVTKKMEETQKKSDRNAPKGSSIKEEIVKKVPVSRNAYETVGGPAVSKKPTSRPAYETVGANAVGGRAAPKGPGESAVKAGGQAISRPAYEVIKPDEAPPMEKVPTSQVAPAPAGPASDQVPQQQVAEEILVQPEALQVISTDYFHPIFQINQTIRNESVPRAFCLPSPHRPITQLRICSAVKCSKEYSGTKYGYFKEEYSGVWVDNCDRVNECWINQTAPRPTVNSIFHHANLIDRDACIRADPSNCPNDGVIAAIVWLQHLTCEMNPSRTGDPCEGLPIRLWQCLVCQLQGDRLAAASKHAGQQCGTDSFDGIRSQGCTVACKSTSGNVRYLPMPNGAACKENTSNVAYCFQGACLPVFDGRTKPRNLTECEAEKERAEWWKRYM